MFSIRVGVTALATTALGVLLLAQAREGDPARGKAIYEGKGDCASCHRINGVGSRLGPDLSDIGVPRGGGRGGGGGGGGAAPAGGKQPAPAPAPVPAPAPTLNLAALETSIVDPD